MTGLGGPSDSIRAGAYGLRPVQGASIDRGSRPRELGAASVEPGAAHLARPERSEGAELLSSGLGVGPQPELRKMPKDAYFDRRIHSQ